MKRIFITLVCFCSVMLFASLPSDQDRQKVIDELRVQKSQLGKDTPFSLFDLHLSQQEKDILESLQVQDSVPFDIYGSPEGKESDMILFFESLGNSPEVSQAATASIYRFIMEVLQAYEFPAAWITIRSSKPNSHFDIPRWHTDGRFFPVEPGQDEDSRFKIAVTLKGPGTLLCDVSEQTRKDYGSLYQQCWRNLFPHTMKNAKQEQLDEFDHAIRPKLVQLMALYQDQMKQAETRQGIIFLVGNFDTMAAFHSEPAINADRLFMSILPGTYGQIKHLHDSRQGERPL